MPTRQGTSQDRILAYLKSELKTKGYPPTVREICDAVGLRSTATVHDHLQRLEKRGLIRRDPTKPRALEILSDEEDDRIVFSRIYRVETGTATIDEFYEAINELGYSKEDIMQYYGVYLHDFPVFMKLLSDL